MIVIASDVQIAVALDDCDEAQAVFDDVCPGYFDVLSGDRTLHADEEDPETPTYAVAQGQLPQAEYAAVAALALSAGINHLSVGMWVRADEFSPLVRLPAPEGGSLWEALGIGPVEEPPLF